MLSAWMISVIDGVLTGVGLYALVRLRMYLGPIAGRKLGIWGRRAVWVLLIAAMVILAELDLTWLRNWLGHANPPGTRWYYEAVYATTFLIVGFTLVRWRVLQRRSTQRDQPNGERNDQTNNSRSTL